MYSIQGWGIRLVVALFAHATLLGQAAWAGPIGDFVGRTSPHSRENFRQNFSRDEKDDGKGEIRPVSLIAADKIEDPNLLSGTVYYMVYERDDRDPNDPWGTGIPDFVRRFRSGIDYNGAASPVLDTGSKYLYLYQVVNHQRTSPPIESASVKLIVELDQIRSWGYFHGLGFATKDEDGTVRPLSATHKIDLQTYVSPAPFLKISQSLSLAVVPTTRGEVEPMRDAVKGKIVQVHWDALDPATPPDYVMTLGASGFNKNPSFRAIWSGKNAINKDGRSTAFGFTSNMPPTMEAVRLITTREETRKAAAKLGLEADPAETAPVDGVKLVKNAEGDASVKPAAVESPAGIEGRVPSPYPTETEAAFNPNRDSDKSEKESGAAAPLGGIPQLGNVGPSSSGSGNNGGFIGSRNTGNGSGGGSGSGGGISSGGGGGVIVVRGQGTTVAAGSGTGTGTGVGTSSATNTITIDFNVSQTSQQSQDQYQFQDQKQQQQQDQSQSQNQNQDDNGNVVPEPASLIGLTLGLPALVIAYRRRRKA